MSSSTLVFTDGRVHRWTRLADYVELTKPRIGALVLVTVAVAAVVAGLDPNHVGTLVHTLAGTALVAASASTLNQWLERRTDALMRRTHNRPLVQGRLLVGETMLFAAVTIVGGTLYLALAVNAATAAVGLLTWTMYVWVYTPMKRRTSANTMVGAVAGALPVLMGWTCVERPLDLGAATLFVVVFLWQFPHFMAIAWIHREDYGAAGLKMLTVVDPSGRRAGAQAVMAALVLVPVSLVPALELLEPVYFAAAALLGFAQLACAIAFMIRMDQSSARRLLHASLVYLPTLLVLLMMVPLI